jgi:predicted permease
MRGILQDVRVGTRMLLKTPGFTLVAVVVLALGIGVNTAVFTLVNAMLLKPLNGGRTGELTGVYNVGTRSPGVYRAVSYPDYVDLRDRSGVFVRLAALDMAMTAVSDQPGGTRQAFVGLVSSNYFDTLGTTITHGRGFTADEERGASGARVVVASHAYWRRTGLDPSIVGRTLTLAGQTFTIVGVAPEGFTGTMALVAPELWLPLSAADLVQGPDRSAGPARLADRGTHRLMLAGVLAPGVTGPAASERLDAFGRQLAGTYPGEDRDHTFTIHRMSRLGLSTAPSDDSEVGTVTALLMAMAAVVLVVACLNLANMLLARGAARRKEIAIRLAIGGGRGRLVRQLLTEGLLLATVGAAAGLVLAFWATRAFMLTLVPVMPLPVTFDATPDGRVLALTVAFAVISTLVASLGPAWSLTRPDLVGDLKDQPRSVVLRRGWRSLVLPRELMVAGQLALSLMLLTSGGLFLRGALAASAADPGFELERGLVVTLDPSAASYDEARGRASYAGALDRLRSIPGIEAASLASLVPFGDVTEGRDVESPGAKRPSASPNLTVVSADYFASLGLPIVRGRGFTRTEETDPRAPRVAMVNDALARQLWPDQDPIGRELRFTATAGEPAPPVYQVVGVVPGVRHQLFDRVPTPHLYLPAGGHYRAPMTLHLRLRSGDAAAEHAMLATARRELQAFDRQLPILAARTLSEHRDASIALWLVKAGAALFTTFGALALVLAGTGLYGVRAYLVSRRTREIGIRMAVGADARDVVRLILREGLRITAVGLAAGALLSVAAATAIASLVYRVSPFDPVTFVTAPLVLLAAALLASWLPARRATRIAPVTALRTE